MDFDADRITYSKQNLLPSLNVDPSTDNGNGNGNVNGNGNGNGAPLFPNSNNPNEAGGGFGGGFGAGGGTPQLTASTLLAYTRHFREFLRNYRTVSPTATSGARGGQSSASASSASSSSTSSTFLYRLQLTQMSRRMENYLEVDLSHLGEYDQGLLQGVRDWPEVVMGAFEEGARQALNSLWVTKRKRNGDEGDEGGNSDEEDEQGNEEGNGNGNDGNSNSQNSKEGNNLPIQILLKSTQTPLPLRAITSTHVNTLLKCPGIIISSARIRSKAMLIKLRCSKCNHKAQVRISNPFGNANLPSRCGSDVENGGNECGPCPYAILPDECTYVDLQSLKLQEPPELVPTGEMPRNIVVSVERSLVDRAKPGDRVMVVGVAGLMTVGDGKNGQTTKKMYLRAFGIMRDGLTATSSSSLTFTPLEEDAFLALSRRSDIYEVLCRSIAPSISGAYTVDIKKAIVCQLMGGSAKRLPDGMRLRGDINVLLLGDPSTAKSQFLKFVEKVAPVGVYTSGKGSSAAGLTASVIKDAKGEFYLEGGAMVLADGGVVCIDEFDKMRPADRVAIHEAMEQQTISIAKAGITTVLNSRASVLAAANPIFGRYDDLRSAGENIDLMTTILSRFDLIFIVRDIRDEERDKAIARHVMGIHVNSKQDGGGQGQGGVGVGISNENGEGGSLIMDTHGSDGKGSGGGGNASASTVGENAAKVAANGGDLDIPTMKKFVQYCRTRCSPRLSAEAGDVLSSAYVKIRDDVRKRCLAQGADGASAVPITVRQLEALVRLSESLAKMRLSGEVAAEDVAEALRLFKVSTMAASETDSNNSGSDLMRGVKETEREEYVRAEAFVASRIGVGVTANRSRLIDEAVGVGWNALVIARVIAVLCQKGEMSEKNSGRLIKRLR